MDWQEISERTMIVGMLGLSGYGGNVWHAVEVIGQTPKRWRIKAITDTRLGGRNRTLCAGDTALVPKSAVRDRCQQCNGRRGGVPGNENMINGRRVCDYCHVLPAPPRVKEG